MVYITVKQSPQYHQMTLDELLFDTYTKPYVVNQNESATRTYSVESVSERFLSRVHIGGLIHKLEKFNAHTEELRAADRNALYHHFFIPKRSGGLRRIDAPLPELMTALRELKLIFEQDFHALYHTASFAYVKKRCTVDAVKKHQQNESRWFCKLDLHDFFGSTTMEFVLQMFSMVFPFSEVMKDEHGRAELEKALELAFLNGGLPQGTPISPLITNVMMIPVDFKLFGQLRDFQKNRFVYTRYADDFIISSRYDFDYHAIEVLLLETLEQFHAPFTLNCRKTRYGSSAGQNWNLGVMLNKDNQITVGHKRKKQFMNMLYGYVNDKKSGVDWDLSDVQTMNGLYSYYHMIEPKATDSIVDHISKKMGADVFALIKADLRR